MLSLTMISNLGKVILFIIFFVAFIVLGTMFLFRPFMVSGGPTGPYINGQTVFTISKLFRRIQLHDVVIFTGIRTGMDDIAYVVGMPGDKVENAFYLSNIKYTGETVSPGMYAVQYGGSVYQRIIPENTIKFIVWYPFK